MNKKGFVFLESVVVLVVVALALAGFLTTYTILANRMKNTEYYDSTSDKYLLYAISSIGTTGVYNLSNCSEDFSLSVSDLDSSDPIYLDNMYKSRDTLKQLFEDSGLVYLYLVNDINSALKSDEATYKYDNGVLQYMDSLDGSVNEDGNNKKYLIGVFKRSGHYYYSSIYLGNGNASVNAPDASDEETHKVIETGG